MGKRNKRARILLKKMSISGEIPSLEVARRFGIEKEVQAAHDEKTAEQAKLEAQAKEKAEAKAKAKAEEEAKAAAELEKKKATEAAAKKKAPEVKKKTARKRMVAKKTLKK
jgi:translation initiation factor IF-2